MMRARHYYTPEEDEWLRSYICSFDSRKTLVTAFNSEFCTDVSISSITQRCSKVLNIRSGAHHRYSEEEKAWLREAVTRLKKYTAVTDEFNRIFGTDIDVTAIQTMCTRYLKVGIGKSCTSFKPGERTRSLPIGTIRKSQTGTYIKVKDETIGISGYQEPDWLPLQKKLWQDVYGYLEDGYMVCFLNHDASDFRLENLYPINRKISAIMSKNKWWSENPDITLTAIKWCELHYAIIDI